MAGTKEQILDILKKPNLAALATIDEAGKPWVRYVMAVGDPEMTLRCATFVKARKVEHVTADPEVHITCGVTDPDDVRPYLQIQARAELTTDESERHSFWNDALANIFAGPDDPNYGILKMKAYRIELCTPGSMRHQVWEREA